MNRVDFGRLISSLRKEHDDEEERPWSQERLAQEANAAAGVELFTIGIISSIERGERHLDQQTLVALAKALQLTTGERMEFFLAASGVGNERIAREESDPEEVASQLIGRMGQVCAPANVVDAYFDTLAVNSLAVEVFDLEPLVFRADGQWDASHTTNMLLFSFSDEGARHFAKVVHDWGNLAYESVRLFRAISLRYRSTEQFRNLLAELKKTRLFRRCWREAYLEEGDLFADSRRMCLSSTKWGPLECFPTYLTAPTTAGDLYLCVYNPANCETAEVFLRIARQVTRPGAVLVGTWPRKTPLCQHPAAG